MPRSADASGAIEPDRSRWKRIRFHRERARRAADDCMRRERALRGLWRSPMTMFNHDDELERVRPLEVLDYDIHPLHGSSPDACSPSRDGPDPCDFSDPEMAYRFKFNERLEEGARRILEEQIARAKGALVAGVEGASAVHETRKCIKRSRSLLRLIRPGLGTSAFRSLDNLFRSIANELSASRDAEILTETLQKLAPYATAEQALSIERLTAALGQDRRPKKAAKSAATKRALAGLKAADHAVSQLAIRGDGFAALEKGLAAEMQKARQQFVKAYAGDNEEVFHDWRKAAQRHWRHMQLLVRSNPGEFEERIAVARALSQVLGENQDLAILREHIEAAPKDGLAPEDLECLGQLISSREQALREAAAPLGAKLFADRPTRFAKRACGLWRTAAEHHADQKKASLTDGETP